MQSSWPEHKPGDIDVWPNRISTARIIHAVAFVQFTFFCAAGLANAGDVVVVESKDHTSKDIGLKFELEKTTWDTDIKTLKLWGTVENTGEVKYRSVQVIFTARDKNKEFLGRNSWFVAPDNIGHEEVGYIDDKFIETEGRKPAIVEFKVVGEKVE